MLLGNTAYCVKLSGEDFWRYSNKIESVGLRMCPYHHSLKAKFHYAILVADRSEAGRRPAVSWNLAYHPAR